MDIKNLPMTLWDKLLKKAHKKWPADKRDCRLKREKKATQRQWYMLHWIKKYKERYDRLYNDKARHRNTLERHTDHA
jgi:hypothetical protein